MKPEFDFDSKNTIDEDEEKMYTTMVKSTEEEDKDNKSKVCYIFLLDQSGSMSGERINLSCKSLLLFLQSLDENSYIQLS